MSDELPNNWIAAARPEVPELLAVQVLARVQQQMPSRAKPPSRWVWLGAVVVTAAAAALVFVLLWPRDAVNHGAITTRPPSKPSVNGAGSGVPLKPSAHGTGAGAPLKPTAHGTGSGAPPAPLSLAARHDALGVSITVVHRRVNCVDCHGADAGDVPQRTKLATTCLSCHPAVHDKRFAEPTCRDCHAKRMPTSGPDSVTVDQVVEKIGTTYASEVRACVALIDKKRLSATTVVVGLSFTILKDGSIGNAQANSANERVDRCIAAKVPHWRFGPGPLNIKFDLQIAL